MRILRRTFLILLLLLVIGWIVAWFAGRWIIQSRVAPELASIQTNDLAFTSQSLSVGGFPFHYNIRPNEARLALRGSGRAIETSDVSVRASVPGSLWGVISGGQVGGRVDVSGVHSLADLADIRVRRGWATSNLANLSLSRAQPNWALGTVAAELSDVDFMLGELPLGGLDGLSLSLRPTGQGHDLAFSMTSLGSETPLFLDVPSEITALNFSGQVRPRINAGLLDLMQAVIANDTAMLAASGDDLASFQEAGLSLNEFELVWGDAKLLMTANAVLTRNAAGGFDVNVTGDVGGQGLETAIRTLVREPMMQFSQASGMVAGISASLALARGFGVDLEGGKFTPFELRARLTEAGLQPTSLSLNGIPLPL